MIGKKKILLRSTPLYPVANPKPSLEMENEEKIRLEARRRLEEQLKQYRVQRHKERVSKCRDGQLSLSSLSPWAPRVWAASFGMIWRCDSSKYLFLVLYVLHWSQVRLFDISTRDGPINQANFHHKWRSADGSEHEGD